MAFSYTRNISDKEGYRMVHGTYTNAGGSTGGDMITGLKNVFSMTLQPLGTAVSANQPVVNESLTADRVGKFVKGGTITIVTSANESGFWLAIGN